MSSSTGPVTREQTRPAMWSYRVAAPGQIVRSDRPAPVADDLRAGEVLIHAEAGGICGSDLVYFRNGWPRPAPAGADPTTPTDGGPTHEVAGVVVASRDTSVDVGARVVGWATRFDGLAEFVITDGDALYEYDDGLMPVEAIALQTLACVIHAVDRLPDLTSKSVTVLGLGPIGMLFSHVIKERGAAHVVGIDAVDRSDLAPRFAVDELIWSRSDRWVAGTPSKADIVIESIGHQPATFQHAVEAAAPGGTVFYFGVPDDEHYVFPIAEFFRKNLVLISGVTDNKRTALSKAQAYASGHPGLLTSYITHVLPRSAVQEGFELASQPATGQLKIVLDYRS